MDFWDDASRALRNVMLADGGFVGQLGDADAVYVGYPDEFTGTRFVVLEMLRANPTTGLSGVGRWKPTVQFNLYDAGDPQLLRQLARRLLDLLSIPLKRVEPIAGESVTITGLRFDSIVEMQPANVRTIEGTTFHHHAMQAQMILER